MIMAMTTKLMQSTLKSVRTASTFVRTSMNTMIMDMMITSYLIMESAEDSLRKLFRMRIRDSR